MEKDFLELGNLTEKELIDILNLADDIKKNPEAYSEKMKGKTLLMMFEKPSLRTRLSFEIGMTQLGGHAVYYDLYNSPMGKKESIADTAKTASRYADIIMARLFSHQNIIELAKNAFIPVINALTDFSHPCQVLSDLQTIREKKKKFSGLKLTYLGDGNNNVTHSLIEGCSILGIDISIACPPSKEYQPNQKVIENSLKINNNSKILITSDPIQAIKDADIVYTDSWMSYHIPENMKEKRIATLTPYQVNEQLMRYAKKDAIFMHCLPAMRGMEQTSEIIDGSKSIVFDQAENRLHAQKALILTLINKTRRVQD